MQMPNDTPIKSMTEYHRRYGIGGRILHLGFEVYCKHCGKRIKIDSHFEYGARDYLLSEGWGPRKEKFYEFWFCPRCKKEVANVS